VAAAPPRSCPRTPTGAASPTPSPAVSRGEVVLGPEIQAGLRRRSGCAAAATARACRRASARSSATSPRAAARPRSQRLLFLSPATVKSHLGALYEKLGVSDRAAAVAEAMRRGLLE
jgi:two-component system nitrate/nitrite response regulator NarL